MKKGANVKITKLCACSDAKCPTPDMQDYVPGQVNPDEVSLPADYTVKGYLVENIQQGHRVMIDRYERNGVKVGGIMVTSPVKVIRNSTFETDNSIYIVELL
jgi:hypothetical protein